MKLGIDQPEAPMPISFRAPEHWRDWLSWALGFWLLLSPWTLGYADDTPGMRNAVLIGFALIFTEAVTLTAFRPWEEWASALIGAWLVAAPFVLKFLSPVGTANAVVIGAIVLLLSVYELWQIRSHDQRAR